VKRNVSLVAGLSAVLLAILAGPAGAQADNANVSCVGWFASSNASASGAGFGAEISSLARTDRPFGATTVSVFVHLPLEVCQSD